MKEKSKLACKGKEEIYYLFFKLIINVITFDIQYCIISNNAALDEIKRSHYQKYYFSN